MENLLAYTTAFGLGFFGGAHCIGMCGGIMGALSFAVPEANRGARLALLLSYNLGRITTYTLMGALLGALGGVVSGGHGMSVLRLLAGVLLICMGFYLADWWRGLSYLERVGHSLWRHLQPLGQRLMPVTSAPRALLLGAVWGWLPCGLVYSALAYATATATPFEAGATMLAFGLGTLPAVLASGIFAQRLKSVIQRRQLRTLFALAIIGFGVWTIAAAGFHFGHGGDAETEPGSPHHHHSGSSEK